MLIGAGGGSLLGLLTDPDRADGAAQDLAPAQQVAPSTTRRPRSRFAGATSTTTRDRPRTLPTVTAALTPATTARPATTTAPRTTTTTRASTTTTTGPSTTTTTTAGDGTTTSSSGPSTTTSTT
jgi:hypothetical protein